MSLPCSNEAGVYVKTDVRQVTREAIYFQWKGLSRLCEDYCKTGDWGSSVLVVEVGVYVKFNIKQVTREVVY